MQDSGGFQTHDAVDGFAAQLIEKRAVGLADEGPGLDAVGTRQVEVAAHPDDAPAVQCGAQLGGGEVGASDPRMLWM